MATDVMRDATLRDISAARAELSGRRDQLVAEYDERLSALEQVVRGVETGEMDLRKAQARVRALLGDRGAAAASPRRAGRTTIGMPVPMGQTPSASTGGITGASVTSSSRLNGPTTSRTGHAVRTVISGIDSRIVELLAEAASDAERQESRFELALLAKMRRALETHLESLPRDVVLLGSVMEYADLAQQTLTDLTSEGSERIVRLLDFDRALVSELVALGGNGTAAKDKIRIARELLAGETPDLAGASAHAFDLFAKLNVELERHFPSTRASLLDEVLR